MLSEVECDMRRTFLNFLVLITLGLSWKSVRADEDLNLIVQRIRQNREVIHSIDCSFEIVPLKKPHAGKSSPSNHAMKVHWRQVHDTIRWNVTSDWNSLNDSFLWKDGVKKAIASQSLSSGGKPVGDKPINTGSYITASNVEGDMFSPWMAAAYRLDFGEHPLACAFLERKDANVAMKKIVFKGSNALELSGIHDSKNKAIVVVDPARNHSILSTVSHLGRTTRTEREVMELKEVRPGIYVPKEIELRFYLNNSLYYSSRITFSSIRLNEEIDRSQMELTFPEGLSVIDRTKNTTYKTGPNESVARGTTKPLPLGKDEQDALDAQRPWYKRLNYWLGISAGIFLLMIAALFIKRNKPRAATP